MSLFRDEIKASVFRSGAVRNPSSGKEAGWDSLVKKTKQKSGVGLRTHIGIERGPVQYRSQTYTGPGPSLELLGNLYVSGWVSKSPSFSEDERPYGGRPSRRVTDSTAAGGGEAYYYNCYSGTVIARYVIDAKMGNRGHPSPEFHLCRCMRVYSPLFTINFLVIVNNIQ
ncbi:hypothetical protein J6590_039500 [Homalodisca vitripennis]|nr:hypothetical protein J6590_039500 [Homalodisca vitripennis]